MFEQAMRELPALAAAGAILSCAASRAATPALVSDLLTSNTPRASNPALFVEFDGGVLFGATRYDVGGELWRFDLSTQQTTLLCDLLPGPQGGLIGFGLKPVVAAGRIFFLARDAQGRIALWTTNGTRTGTNRVPIESTVSNSILEGDVEVVGTDLVAHVSIRDGVRRLWRVQEGIVTPIALPAWIATTPPRLRMVGERLHFWHIMPGLGVEPWTVAPGSDSAEMIKDINPGPASSYAGLPRVALSDSLLLFAAFTPATGFELWRSDGTPQGTTLVRDIDAGTRSGLVNGYPSQNLSTATVNGYVYFSAQDQQSGNFELWRSDGTQEGTSQVVDLQPGAMGSRPENIGQVNDRVFFQASSAEIYRGIFSTDGTSTGTQVIWAPENFVAPDAPVTVDKLAYFRGYRADTGRELWATDGTTAGTFLVEDLAPGRSESDPRNLTATATAGLFYVANGLEYQGEPRRILAGAGQSELVANVAPDAGSAAPTELTAVGSRIFFVANGDGQSGRNLWYTDINGVITDSIEFGGAQAGTSPAQLTSHAGYIFYAVNGNDGAGIELWHTDATTLETTRPFDLEPKDPNSNIAGLTSSAFGLLFAASDGFEGQRPYRYDPNESAAPSRLANVADTGVSGIVQFRVNAGNDRVFFAGDSRGELDAELWVYSGLTDSASEIDINSGPTGPGSSSPTNFSQLGDRIVFSAIRNDVGRELWCTDGTVANTSLVADINPGAANSDPRNLFYFDDKIVFVATTETLGVEPYAVQSLPDGRVSAPVLLADIVPGVGSSASFGFARAETMPGVVFAATSPESGREIWITDGTTAGTQLLLDIYPGPLGSSPAHFNAANGFVYFTATSPDHGTELWRTDGTPEGTTLYADILPGPDGSVPTELESGFTKLYFSAETPALGRELWSIAIPTGLTGDMNCDGFVTVADIGGFVLSLTDSAAYAVHYPACDLHLADVNDDGFVTVADIGGFVLLLTGG